MKVHEKYIRRCIELAKNGLGTTYPNPMVGCVIVHDGRIIGEGWHRKAGDPHAEVLAIGSVADKSLLAQSTIYVSLEPCSHWGKTPPCSDLIVKNGIPRVVIGTSDTFSEVAGNGIRKLREAGCEVTVGVLETECRALNRRFFTFHEKKRPYIILKWAQSQDGFLSPATRTENRPVWVTGRLSRRLVHKWRTEEAAILVGTQTVLDDDPKLNARDWAGNDPVRLVLDRSRRIPASASVLDGSLRTIVLTENPAPKGHVVEYEKTDFAHLAAEILRICHEKGLLSVMVEGGAQTLQTFLDSGIWDEARVFTGAFFFGEGIMAPRLSFPPESSSPIGEDLLQTYYNHD